MYDEILTESSEMEFVQFPDQYYDWESENVQSRKCYEVAGKQGYPECDGTRQRRHVSKIWSESRRGSCALMKMLPMHLMRSGMRHHRPM